MKIFDEDKFIGFSFEVGVAALAIGRSTGPVAFARWLRKTGEISIG